MPENLVKIAQNDKGHVGVSYVGNDKVRVFVSAKDILDKLAQYFRPDHWQKTQDGYERICSLQGGTADYSVGTAEYALQQSTGQKLRKFFRWRSWRSQLKRTIKE